MNYYITGAFICVAVCLYINYYNIKKHLEEHVIQERLKEFEEGKTVNTEELRKRLFKNK